MTGFQEFKYSFLVFLVALLFILPAFSILYWIFNIYHFPPILGRGNIIIICLALLIPTYFIEIQLIKRFKLSEKRKYVTIYSSLFCILLMLFPMADIISFYNSKSKTISTIEEVYDSKSLGLTINNFEISNQPIIYKHIKINKKSGTHYLQVYFLYPFKNKHGDNIYYSLQFETIADTKFYTEEELLDNLLKDSEARMQNYDFQKIKNFEYLTVMDPDYEQYQNATNHVQSIFLKPIKKTFPKEYEDLNKFNFKFMIIMFLGYIVVFLLSRIEDWK